MSFLVVDDRFGTPIHVFLEIDPRGAAEYPGLPAREVRLDRLAAGQRPGPHGPAVGQDPWNPAAFREFGSDGAAAAARFTLVEPRYVGHTWATYLTGFRPAGGAPRPRQRAAGGPVRC